MGWVIGRPNKTYQMSDTEDVAAAINIAKEGAECFSEAVKLEHKPISIFVGPRSETAEIRSRYDEELEVQGTVGGRTTHGITGRPKMASSSVLDVIGMAIAQASGQRHLVSMAHRGISVLVGPDSKAGETERRYKDESSTKNQKPERNNGKWTRGSTGGIITYEANHYFLPPEAAIATAIHGADLLNENVVVEYGGARFTVNSDSNPTEVLAQYSSQYARQIAQIQETAQTIAPRLITAINAGNTPEVIECIGALARTGANYNDYDGDDIFAAFTAEHSPYREYRAGSTPPRTDALPEAWETFIIGQAIDYLQQGAPFPPRFAEWAEQYEGLPDFQVKAGTQHVRSPEQEQGRQHD